MKRGPYSALTATAVGGWLVAFLLMFLDGAPFWSVHTRLTVGGFALEAVGVILLALDILNMPLAPLNALVRRLRSVLFGGKRQRVYVSDRATSFEDAGVAVIHLAPGEQTPLDQLRAEFEQLRAHVDVLSRRQETGLAGLRAEVDATRIQLTDAIHKTIEESRSAFFAWRIAGFVVALFGSGVLALANLR
jgi:hypothetical protein